MTDKSFEWMNANSRNYLKDSGYLSEGEDPIQRVKDIADRAEELSGIEGFSEKFFTHMSHGWYSLASPVWANYGKVRGLPVSCFGSFIEDSIPSLLYTNSEIGIMSKLGGGTSPYFGEVRPRGSSIKDAGKSSGSVHFMKLTEQTTSIVSQGGVRRGRAAAYLPADHGDIHEFLNIGTHRSDIQSMTTAVCCDDEFMQSIKVRGEKSTDNRAVWSKMLGTRGEIGYPYVSFTGNMNRNKPQVYKDKGMEIVSSNLCNEISLPLAKDESFVCVLSSLNLEKWDEWKDTDAAEVLTIFLDTVVTETLEKLEKLRDSSDMSDQLAFQFMERAYNFCERHRAVGVGVLGWHSYLQSNMIPFESQEAAKLNYQIFKTLGERTKAASTMMADAYGEPEVLKGYGMRNTTTMALAPTTSSAFILGQTSQSIEPLMSNYYIKDVAKAKVPIKNKHLEALLESYDMNVASTWESISKRDGSVQHLSFLTGDEKKVFLTFSEINQAAILHQAGVRQEFLDQGQSINLMINQGYTPKDISKLHLMAYDLGLLGLYYQHNVNAAREFARGLNEECVACSA